MKVAALRGMLTPEMSKRYMEGPNTHPELRAGVGVYVGEKLVKSGQDIGECDDTVAAVNAGKKGSGWGSAQPRKQVKFDPPRVPTPNTGDKRPRTTRAIDDRRKAKKKDLLCNSTFKHAHFEKQQYTGSVQANNRIFPEASAWAIECSKEKLETNGSQHRLEGFFKFTHREVGVL